MSENKSTPPEGEEINDKDKETIEMTNEELIKSAQELANNKVSEEVIAMPESELEKAQREAEDFKDKYLRLLAETENSRKRIQKERHELTKYAIQNIISEFIHPLDTFENALASAENVSGEIKNWAFGFEMILNQFRDILENHGVVPFKSEGMPFNPHDHEAVEVEETEEHPDGTILKVFIKGYKMGDKTIRPAHVKVAKTPKSEEIKSEDSSKETADQGKKEDTKATNHK
jgi:molecular chaperone GrpE